MTPTICDVFSNRNLMLSYLSSHYGNVYVTGNLDLIYCCNPIEIFGDIVVDGVLSGCDIIVHGNIECYDLHCDSIKVDGDILISGHASVSNQMKSFGGNIRILGSADIPNLIASEGSIYVGDKINVNCIKAFDSIYVNGNIIAAAEINMRRVNHLAEENEVLIVENLAPAKNDEALFHLFNLFSTQNKWLLLTAEKAPAQMKFGLKDLQTRLNMLPCVGI